jgi:hypothetical protein
MRRNKNTQKIPSRVLPSKWAHLIEKTDEQSLGTDIHKLGAHLAVSRTKGGARSDTYGPAEPHGRPAALRRQSASVLAGSSCLSSRRRLSEFPPLSHSGTDLLGL